MSVEHFLLICSGADRELLARRAFYAERRRFAAIGASVLLTAAFAFISATYVVNLIFGSVALAAGLGLLWALLIFVIDRLLLSTIRAHAYRPGLPLIDRLRQQRSTFLAALPRLVIATLIAFPIAIPIQIRLFKPQINEDIARERMKAYAQVKEQVERSFPESATLRMENAELDLRLRQKEEQVDDLLQTMLKEPTGSLTGPVFNLRRAEYVRARRELDEQRVETKNAIETNRRNLEQLQTMVTKRQSTLMAAIDWRSGNLVAQVDALRRLKSANSTIAGASLIIAILFVLIQVSPVLASLVANRGPDAYFVEAIGAMATRDDTLPAANGIAYTAAPHDGSPTNNRAELTGGNSSRHLRAFMCHCSEDKHAVRILTKRLQHDGIKTWLDEENLLPGQNWDDEITKAVRASDVVVVCLSRKAIKKSGYVQREIRFAIEMASEQPEGAIFLVPTKLEECDVPLKLRDLQFVRIYEPTGYERLLNALQRRAEQVASRTNP